MANCFLLLTCLLFSFACNLVHKIYDNQSYAITTAMLQNAALSGLVGFCCSFVFNELFFNEYIAIMISCICGFFGIKGVEFVISAKIDSNIEIDDALKQLLEEDNISTYEPTGVLTKVIDKNINQKIYIDQYLQEVSKEASLYLQEIDISTNDNHIKVVHTIDVENDSNITIDNNEIKEEEYNEKSHKSKLESENKPAVNDDTKEERKPIKVNLIRRVPKKNRSKNHIDKNNDNKDNGLYNHLRVVH